jgi:UDP:flavonoid glycosyltransferase YjiC (YdhE family)
MAVLAAFVGGWGHAEPLLEVAELAKSFGHQVTFAGQQALVPRIAAMGYDTAVIGPDTLGSKRLPLQRVDRELERTVMRDHFVTQFGSVRGPAICELIDNLAPQVVLCDEVDFGAIAAAECAAIPCVTVNVVAAGRLVSPEVVGPAWNQLRHTVGLTDDDPDGQALGGTLTLAPFAASFRAPELVRPPQWRPVRPTLPPVAIGSSACVRVYATLGTVFNVESGDLLARLVAGLGRVPLDSLITIGPNIGVDEFDPAPHVRIEQFVAQRDVLGQCDAVVCHGGSGTLMAALSVGVPVVVIPMGADQPDNADRCEDLGCGVVLDPLDATPDDIAEAVTQVTSDPRYQCNARQLASEVEAQPALRELPELVELLSA